MQYQYILPFITTTLEVMDQVIQSDISKGRMQLINKKEIYGDVSVLIKISGVTEGDIVLNMDNDTALNVSNIMTGMKDDSLSSLGMDAIAELGNMIAGNATCAVHDQGFELEVSPPRVYSLKKLFQELSSLEVFQIPLFTECGEITMNVAIRTN